MHKLSFLFLFLCIPGLSFSYNNGEDITTPPQRVDLRVKYRTDVNVPQGSDWTLTVRSDLVFSLPHAWQISTRADLPYTWYRCQLPEKMLRSLAHWNDSLIQLFVIPPAMGSWKFGFGAKWVFPTANDHLQIGEGKYQMLPTCAFRYELDQSPGSFMGGLIRYGFSYAGYRSAPSISQLFLQPLLNLNFSHGWFINSSPEIIYNFVTKCWFIPLDLLIGKMIQKNTVLSLEYSYGIVNDYNQYQQQIEFRVGYFY